MKNYLLFRVLCALFIVFAGRCVQGQAPADTTTIPATPTVTPAATTGELPWRGAEIVAIGADQASLQARRNDTTWTFGLTAPALKKILPAFSPGDRVDLTYTSTGSQKTLTALAIEKVQTGKWQRIWTLAGSVAGVLLFFRLLLRRKLRNLILGADNRYSNSNFQIVMWFFTLIVTYIAVTILRGQVSIDFVGGVDIPSNLLLLSGFSALTFATAKGITESKNQEAIKQNQMPKQPATEPHFPTDLFQDDTGMVDMADFQMVVITILAVAVYTFQVYDFLSTIELHRNVTLPDVDSTILATFGLGHGAYLAKKYVGGINS
nr:hypothetical protein [uncultured Dyadobacter sp.]